MNLSTYGLLSLFTHLLTNEATNYFKCSLKLSFCLHYDVTLPDLALHIAIADIFEVNSYKAFLFEAVPKPSKKEVSFEIKKLSISQFIFDRHVVVLCILS